MQAFYGTRISEHISESPEGFLICHSAPLCRTATKVPQKYRGSELGLPTDELFDVYRSPDAVLSKKFLASLEGKPVTDAHPGQFLTSSNVGWYSRGHVQNVKPGPVLPDGERSITGDLVITDPGLIAKIKAGVRELSVGYTYDLQDDARGKLRQTNLAANHVAVVQQARGGEHLRIADAKPEDIEGDEMQELVERMEKIIALLERVIAASTDTVEDELPTSGDWAEDSGALAELRKLRPFVEASGDRKVIDGYNQAVLALKRQSANLVNALDSRPGRRVTVHDSRAERARTFEEMVGRYHRRYFHLRSDREELPAEEQAPHVAQDAGETFDDSISRHRKRLLEKKY